MRSFLRFGVLVAVLAAQTTRADAGAWVEVYTGTRPDQADELLEPMRLVFDERGFVGGDALATEIVAVSRPGIDVPEQQVVHLTKLVELGYSHLSLGRYDSAVERLETAIHLAHGAPAVLVRDDAQRDVVLKALLGIAIAYRRDADVDEDEAQELRRKRLTTEAKQKLDAAKDKRERAELALNEAVRSFFTNEPDPSIYGTEPVQWWRRARERLLASGTGTLIVDPGKTGVTVFVNEGYTGQGERRLDLPPGKYRVYSHRADVPGRVYTVEVTARRVTRLEIDWDFDAALRTGHWVGFTFDSAEQNREFRARFAAQIAKVKGEHEVVVVGLSSKDDGQYAYGVTFNAEGNVLASGEVRLGEEGSAQRLRNLARLLTGEREVAGVASFDATAAPAAWVDEPPLPPPATLGQSPEGKSSSTGALLPVATTGVAVVALGAGLRWMAMGEQCVGYTSSCASVLSTRQAGIATLAVGVTASGVAGYLWGRHRRNSGRLLHGGWPYALGSASAVAFAVGAGVIVADEASLSPREVNAFGLRPFLVGGIVASAGAIGLGFSIYSGMGPYDGQSVLPTLALSNDGAIAGLAGRF